MSLQVKDANNALQALDTEIVPSTTTLIPSHCAKAITKGGATPYMNIDVQTSSVAPVKTTAGQVYGGQVFNAAASVRYLKFYNKATAAVAGTDTPVMVLALPAGAVVDIPHSSVGIAFSTGIAVRACTGLVITDNTAPTANDVILNLLFN